MAAVERIARAAGAVSYRVRWRDDTGRQRSKTFRRRREADAFALTVGHELMTGAYVDRDLGRRTVAEWFAEWFAAQVWAPSTAERVKVVMRAHVLPVLGDRPIGAVRRSHVQALIAELAASGLAPTTIRSMMAHVSAMFRAAELDRIIARSPCERLTLPPVPRAEVVPLTVDEVRALADELGEPWAPMVWTMAGLGLRIGELLGLTVGAVDFLRREVRVERQAVPVRGAGVQLVDRLKSPASHRTIPLPSTVGDVLARSIELHGVGNDGAIFHYEGRLRRRNSVAAAFKRATSRSSAVPDGVTPHDLRHFCASMLIYGGASVVTVQRYLGHASASETLETYAHLWPDSADETRRTVDRLLGAGPASGLEVGGGEV